MRMLRRAQFALVAQCAIVAQYALVAQLALVAQFATVAQFVLVAQAPVAQFAPVAQLYPASEIDLFAVAWQIFAIAQPSRLTRIKTESKGLSGKCLCGHCASRVAPLSKALPHLMFGSLM